MDAHQVTGFVIWLTGMAGAGKTTLGSQILKRFNAAGRPAEFLDGDSPTEILTRGLGVSKEDRDTAVRRLGSVAKMLARHGAAVVVASLSPYREARDAVRREVRRFAEVFVDAPMETLLARDSEGLYKKALAHELTNVAGIDDPYEPPSHAELVVRTDQEKADIAASRLFQKLVDMKLLQPAEFAKLSGGQRPKRAAAKAQRPGKKGAAPKKGSAKSKAARAAKRSGR
jgi:adenylyl-sulfate kinase